MKLTAENYKHGFLVDEEVIGGVTEMAGGVFAAYISHYLTGETYAYEEFDSVTLALDYLATIKRQWTYEAIGCEKGSKSTKTKSGCGSGGCGSGGCHS